MCASRQWADNLRTEIINGRCERDTVEGEARGRRAARDSGRTGVEEDPGHVLAGLDIAWRVGGESGDGERRTRVTVGDGRGRCTEESEEEEHSRRTCPWSSQRRSSFCGTPG